MNTGQSDDFFVGVDFPKVGTVRPSVREVVAPIERWLAGLDPDDVAAAIALGVRPPSMMLEVRHWVLEVRAFPIRAEARGKPGHRLVGMGPVSGGFVNDVEMLRRTLLRKVGRYGRLGEPLVLAVQTISPFFDPNDVRHALYGSEVIRFREGEFADARLSRAADGFFLGRGPRNSRVSAVLVGAPQPHRIGETWPDL